jgi:hypothetical protein
MMVEIVEIFATTRKLDDAVPMTCLIWKHGIQTNDACFYLQLGLILVLIVADVVEFPHDLISLLIG